MNDTYFARALGCNQPPQVAMVVEKSGGGGYPQAPNNQQTNILGTVRRTWRYMRTWILLLPPLLPPNHSYIIMRRDPRALKISLRCCACGTVLSSCCCWVAVAPAVPAATHSMAHSVGTHSARRRRFVRRSVCRRRKFNVLRGIFIEEY